MSGLNEDNGNGVVESASTIVELPPKVSILTSAVEKVLNEICGMISHITHASTVIVAQRDPTSNTIKVRGKTGTLLTEVDMSFVIPKLHAETMPIILSRDVRSDPSLQSHPLLQLMPHIRSLMLFLIPGGEKEKRAVLKVINPRKTAFKDGELIRVLSEMSIIISDLLDMNRIGREPADERDSIRGMLEDIQRRSNRSPGSANEVEGHELNSAAAFLFETLVKKRGLHSRNAVDYVSLRTWRSTVKKYQLGALRALKLEPPKAFVSRAAAEIAASAVQTHGHSVIRSVIPVPPGSSGAKTSLSTMLAEEVARLLGAEYQNVLVPLKPAKLGKSSPHKSAEFAGYLPVQSLHGPGPDHR